MILKLLATIFMLIEALFHCGVTETGVYEPKKYQVVLIITGFVIVLIAIWR